jgi:hypothetical protein
MLWFVWVKTLIHARPSTVLATWLYIVGCAMVMLSTDQLPERRSEKVVAIFAWPIMFPYTLIDEMFTRIVARTADRDDHRVQR